MFELRVRFIGNVPALAPTPPRLFTPERRLPLWNAVLDHTLERTRQWELNGPNVPSENFYLKHGKVTCLHRASRARAARAFKRRARAVCTRIYLLATALC